MNDEARCEVCAQIRDETMSPVDKAIWLLEEALVNYPSVRGKDIPDIARTVHARMPTIIEQVGQADARCFCGHLVRHHFTEDPQARCAFNTCACTEYRKSVLFT